MAPEMCRPPVGIKVENDWDELSSLIPLLVARGTVYPVDRPRMWPTGFNAKDDAQEVAATPPPTAAISPTDPIITIFCGPLTARLHLQYFQCPGIHQPCIEYEGEMVTPKEFCSRANKDKQKDWKGSIRAGKRSLRYMMEIKAIEFYNHMEVCSGKCQSRNHVNPGRQDAKNVKRATIPVPTYPMRPMFNHSGSPSLQHQTYPIAAYVPFGVPPMQMPPGFPIPSLQTPMGVPMPGPMMVQNPELLQEGEMSPTLLAASCMGRGYQNEAPQPNGTMSAKQLLNFIDTDPLTFWNEVRRVQLLPEFLELASNQVKNICAVAGDRTANLGCVAPSLSRLIHAMSLQQFMISRIQDYQNSHFAGLKTQPNETEKKAPPGIGQTEGVETHDASRGEQVINDLEMFSDHMEPLQQQKDMNVPMKHELTSESHFRIMKRRLPPKSEVACKKQILDFDLE